MDIRNRINFEENEMPKRIQVDNGSFRDECFNVNWFLSLLDAKQKIEQWRRDYYGFRPHSSLNNLTPSEVHSEHTESPNSLLLSGTG